MKKLLPNAIIVAIITIISQMLGYTRELIFAFYLGTTSNLEAFQVAETVPLLFTQILISAVPLALTPLMIKEEDDDTLIQNSVSLFSIIMIFLTILIIVFPNLFVSIMAPGFSGDKFILTCRLVTILAPNVVFLSLVSIFTSYLNSRNQFIIPSISVLALNTSIIVMQILTKANVIYVAIGSVVGSIIAFLVVLIVSVLKFNYRPHFNKVSKKKILYILKALIPVCLISSFSSLNLILDKYFASQVGTGSIAILAYSYKIINLPVYLFVTSITKVMLPTVTVLLNTKQHKQLTIIIRKIIIYSLFIGLGIIVVILLSGKLIVTILFGRGAFNTSDILLTTNALKIYSIGIIGLALNSFFQSISYANGKYFQPIIIYIIQLGFYYIFTKIFLDTLKIQAIILGNVLAINLTILIWIVILRKFYKLKVIF